MYTPEIHEIVTKTWPLLCGSLLYLIQAYLFFRQANYGFTAAFIAYAVANFGLIYAALFTKR